MQQSPRPTSWTFDELTVNGWFPYEKAPASADGSWTITLTLYWAEASKHSETGQGATRDEAVAQVERKVNAWLSDKRTYQPRR